MRSVFLHFAQVQEPAVRAWLDEALTRVGENEWHATSAGEPVLFCSLGNSFEDWEHADVAALRSALPHPSSFVQVDVSGRVPGRVEVHELTSGFLGAVPGSVATDDFTSHPWRIDEIQGGVLVQGHPFFDFEGWHEDPAGG